MKQKRKKYSLEFRRDLGRRAATRPPGMTVEAMARSAGVGKSVIYNAMSLYRREQTGLHPAPAVRTANHAPLQVQTQERVGELETENLQLRHDVERLERECHTLQKIVIALGERL